MPRLKRPTLHSYSLAAALALSALLGGCGESMVPVEVTGYNHMSNRAINSFSVNGAAGTNPGPESGGGHFSCCIQIPTRWHPGLKAKVSWEYGSGNDSPQEAEVEIPEYTEQNLGTVQVHFYPNHRIKVLVSRYGLGHPLYPMSAEDQLPWTIDENVVRNLRELKEEEARKK